MPNPISFTLPDWQRICGIPTATGQLRSQPQDFRVIEMPGFALSGDGEHDFLYIEKTSANTSWVARGLARHANVPVRDVGFAGMKDRHAVTRQWFSVRRPGGPKADWAELDLPGVCVLEVARHNRKMRRGAHKGNRFELTVRGLSGLDSALEQRLRKIGGLSGPGSALEQRLRKISGLSGPGSALEQRLRKIRESGVPNYFGEQRFGRSGSNIGLAKSFFAGTRLRREQRSIALSSARSLIFNNILSARVSADNWDTLIAGDVANLEGSGSVFPVSAIDADLQMRCREFDIHPTGVLWGKGAVSTTSEPAKLERDIAEQEPVLVSGLERHTDEGRRALRLVVRDLDWDIDKDELHLRFSLTRGGFATAVLRELLDYDV